MKKCNHEKRNALNHLFCLVLAMCILRIFSLSVDSSNHWSTVCSGPQQQNECCSSLLTVHRNHSWRQTNQLGTIVSIYTVNYNKDIALLNLELLSFVFQSDQFLLRNGKAHALSSAHDPTPRLFIPDAERISFIPLYECSQY